MANEVTPHDGFTIATNTDTGGYAWSNPGNAFSSDNVRASASTGGFVQGFSDPKTDRLELRQWKGEKYISPDSVPLGVQVQIETYWTQDVGPQYLNSYFYDVYLIVNGVIAGSNKGGGVIAYNSETLYTIGGADLWDAPLTPNILKASDFGVSISEWYNGDSAASHIYSWFIDYVSMSVTHHSGRMLMCM